MVSRNIRHPHHSFILEARKAKRAKEEKKKKIFYL